MRHRHRVWTGIVLAAIALSATGCTMFSDTSSSPSTTETATSGGAGTTAKDPSPTPQPPEAVLVFASVDIDGAHVSTSGYVSGVIEDGGSCEFLFTNGSAEVRVPNEGAADRSQTSCGTVQVPTDQLVRGPWTVTLEYTSPDQTKLISSPSTVEIP